jgi:hypothetical protein
MNYKRALNRLYYNIYKTKYKWMLNVSLYDSSWMGNDMLNRLNAGRRLSTRSVETRMCARNRLNGCLDSNSVFSFMWTWDDGLQVDVEWLQVSAEWLRVTFYLLKVEVISIYSTNNTIIEESIDLLLAF